MRDEQEMFSLILGYAQSDERIRVVGMEGSRANPHAPRDSFQDYDISFLVTDMASFQADDRWLSVFGAQRMMQKPEAMELFPAELGNWFSYLMLFEDGCKMDLTLIPLDELPLYLNSDRMLRILLDKDGRISPLPVPTDADYRTKAPTPGCFDDCCNEFWFTCTYVIKELCRGSLLSAAHYFSAIVRVQLLTMLAWQVGTEGRLSFPLAAGKHFKYLPPYLIRQERELLLSTYRLDSVENCLRGLESAMTLFRQSSFSVAEKNGFPYPAYDQRSARLWKEHRETIVKKAAQPGLFGGAADILFSNGQEGSYGN